MKIFCIFADEKTKNMKEFVISEAKAETAVLVGLITQEQNEAKTKEYLDELEFLAETAGAVVVKRFTQRVGGPSSVTWKFATISKNARTKPTKRLPTVNYQLSTINFPSPSEW